MGLFFFGMFFLSPEIDWFFSEIGNNLMRALGRKKTHVFFGNARPKSNARAYLKQRKKHSGLKARWVTHYSADILLYKPWRPQGIFNFKSQKCLLFPLHLNTYVIGLRTLQNILILSERGSFLEVRI